MSSYAIIFIHASLYRHGFKRWWFSDAFSPQLRDTESSYRDANYNNTSPSSSTPVAPTATATSNNNNDTTNETTTSTTTVTTSTSGDTTNIYCIWDRLCMNSLGSEDPNNTTRKRKIQSLEQGIKSDNISLYVFHIIIILYHQLCIDQLPSNGDSPVINLHASKSPKELKDFFVGSKTSTATTTTTTSSSSNNSTISENIDVTTTTPAPSVVAELNNFNSSHANNRSNIVDNDSNSNNTDVLLTSESLLVNINITTATTTSNSIISSSTSTTNNHFTHNQTHMEDLFSENMSSNGK